MADVMVGQIRFQVVRIGSGDRTVVFLHGLVMDNLSSFYFTLAPGVARFANVILYDLRGHGNTARPATGYALSEMVSDLSGVLDAVGIHEPVFLVGHSFGGLLAQAFTVAHPWKVAGMVLIDGLSAEEGWGARMAETLGLDEHERDRQIAIRFQSWMGRHSQRKRNRLASTAEALVRGTSLVDELRGSQYLNESELRTIGCPVLMIYGEHSDMRHAGERLASQLPRCELRIVPGCTHSVLWEATDEVCRQVTEWLSKNR